MKTLMAITVALVTMMAAGLLLQAADLPCGELLELHSCQIYIGGCIASAEATQDGRYLLRMWNFTDGLQVALLETGDENLAEKNTHPTAALAYLPQSASSKQHAALIDWLKRNNRELTGVRLLTRVAPMRFAHKGDNVTFVAGDFVSVNVRPFVACGLTSCGESLWYTPRSAFSEYTVGVTSESIVREPLLSLTWIDHGKNNVFQGRFSEGATIVAHLAAHE